MVLNSDKSTNENKNHAEFPQPSDQAFKSSVLCGKEQQAEQFTALSDKNSKAMTSNMVACGLLPDTQILEAPKAPITAAQRATEGLRQWDALAEKRITENGLPESWHYKEGQDKYQWRQSVGQLIDLSTHVAKLANVIDKLKLPIDQPDGSKILTNRDGTKMTLDLPKDPDLNNPETANKVGKLVEWSKKVEPQLESVRSQLDAIENNPTKALSWGDTTIRKVKDANGNEIPGQVRLDKDGHFLGLVNPAKDKPNPGETFQDANLLEQRFNATTDPKTGEIVVQRHTQAQDVPWYSYQNMIYSNVGKEAANPAEERYKPDDPVAINDGSTVRFVKAKDLQAYQEKSEFYHYGAKALNTGLDVAMVVTGTVELGAAAEGAVMLARGVEGASLAASGITAAGVAATGLKGLWNVALGAGGITSNASFDSSEAGREASMARSLAFLGTVGYGFAAPKVGKLLDIPKLANPTLGATEAAFLKSNAAAKIAKNFAGQTMKYGMYPIMAEQGFGLASTATRIGERVALAAGYDLPSDWAPFDSERAADALKAYDADRANSQHSR
ncbi:MAG TPA: hypothetical protein V6C76_06895 [Drouetiella sp.]